MASRMLREKFSSKYCRALSEIIGGKVKSLRFSSSILGCLAFSGGYGAHDCLVRLPIKPIPQKKWHRQQYANCKHLAPTKGRAY